MNYRTLKYLLMSFAFITLVGCPSISPNKVLVPYVVDQTRENASTAIKDTGLVIGSLEFVNDDFVKVGYVISQEPLAGIYVDENSNVTLYISLGKGEGEAENTVAFTKQVDVFGIHIYAMNTTGDDKILHAANILAEYLDNDEDGIPDDQTVVDVMVERNVNIVMTKDYEEFELLECIRPSGWVSMDQKPIPMALPMEYSILLSKRFCTL